MYCSSLQNRCMALYACNRSLQRLPNRLWRPIPRVFSLQTRVLTTDESDTFVTHRKQLGSGQVRIAPTAQLEDFLKRDGPKWRVPEGDLEVALFYIHPSFQTKQEKFVRGSGNGGQKVNKTNNNVQIRHIPTGIIVHCHTTRSLETNRKMARARMANKIEALVRAVQQGKDLESAEFLSEKDEKRRDKIRRQKAKKKKKALIKHAKTVE